MGWLSQQQGPQRVDQRRICYHLLTNSYYSESVVLLCYAQAVFNEVRKKEYGPKKSDKSWEPGMFECLKTLKT